MRSAAARRFGFTLVELLVVIGIIAILVGVLLPVLGSARRAANKVQCGAALREIGNAFKLYSIDNKGKLPVAKWYILPAMAPPRPVLSNGAQVSALYWQDFLTKYVTKNATMNSTALDPNKQQAFALARASIFWGCPEWQGRYGGFTTPDGISAYENGYSFNVWPTWKTTTPLGQHPPYAEIAVDDYNENQLPSNIQGKPPARYPKLTEYSAERALVCESNLWLFVTCGTGRVAQGPAGGQLLQPRLQCRDRLQHAGLQQHRPLSSRQVSAAAQQRAHLRRHEGPRELQHHVRRRARLRSAEHRGWDESGADARAVTRGARRRIRVEQSSASRLATLQLAYSL